MKQMKRCIAQFTFYDRTGIQAFLEKKAEQGWLLEAISPMFWKFRPVEPKKIHFAVTYFSKASVYDPEPTEQQRTFQEFCEYSGWTLAAINGPLQIFYNESANPLPIETDPMMELKTIHASAKKNFLPSYIMLLIVAVIQLATQIGQLATFPLTYLTQNTTLFSWLSIAALFIMCMQEIGGYFLWYRKAKKAAEESGEFVETKGHRVSQLTLLGVVVAALILLVFTLEPKIAVVTLVCVTGCFGVVFGAVGIREALRRRKASRGTTRAVTIGASVVLSLVVVSGLCFGMVKLVQADFWEKTVETYEAFGMTWEIHHDDLLLTVEDLMETDYDGYSYQADVSKSLLVSCNEGSQKSRVGEDAPELWYEVYDVQLPLIYDFCKEELLSEYDDRISEDIYGDVIRDAYRPVDASLWGAEEAYQLYSADNPYNWYLLCYKDRLVTLRFDWALTEAQMAIVGTVFS